MLYYNNNNWPLTYDLLLSFHRKRVSQSLTITLVQLSIVDITDDHDVIWTVVVPFTMFMWFVENQCIKLIFIVAPFHTVTDIWANSNNL